VHHLHPGYAIYEPGFTRLGTALAHSRPDSPLRFTVLCSPTNPPGASRQQHLTSMRIAVTCRNGVLAPWMVAGLGVDIRPLIAPTVSRDGHVCVGLEDAPWQTPLTNGNG
jgi:3-keto-5-aminohexanoate cleavage enzyme